MTKRLLEEFARHPGQPPAGRLPDRFAELTEREVDVLREVVRGASNSEIADRLYISETTVKTHVNHILSKLGVRDRIQAVVLAYDVGLVEPGGGARPLREHRRPDRQVGRCAAKIPHGWRPKSLPGTMTDSRVALTLKSSKEERCTATSSAP